MATRREKEKGRKSSRLAWTQESSRGGEFLSFKLPDGVELYKLERTGKVELDFLVYRAGKNNLNCDEGMEAMNFIYEVHGIQTPNGYRSVTCRAKHFGKKCAACDWLRTQAGGADPELVRDIRAKTRILWLVNDNPDNHKKPVLKVMDTGFFNKGVGFGELMRDAIEALRDGESAFDLKGGTTAVIKVAEQSFDRKKFKAATRIDLHRRDYDYPASLLDDAPCLDACLVDPGYEAVQRLLTGEAPDEDDEDDEEPKARRNGRHDTEEDDEEMGDDAEEDDPKPRKKSSRVEEEEEDDEEPEDEEEKPAPKAKGKTKGRKPADDDDDEPEEPSDLEEDEDEEEEPRRKSPRR